jgi:hypothetical protein
MLKMHKLDQFFESGHKGDVTTVAMAAKTIQDGRYRAFNALYFKRNT